jgi:hypothetical protein
MALAGLFSACGGGHAASTSSTTVHPGEKCPLTDLSPPGGHVPARPALAVKVDNSAAARPPFGLSTADVIYEEPVEGGLTRFVVIYQCRDAARIEPVRSARIIDPAIVGQFGAHPLFGYAGGIQPAVAAIESSSLIDVGTARAPEAYKRDPDRSAPHNLTTSTAALYAAGQAQHASYEPPPPAFSFGSLIQGATPAASVHIAFPASGLTWTWQPGSQLWLRSYAQTGPAELGEGGQLTASNVIVMKVVMYPSPYVEDATGAHENLLILTGSGPAEVFRDGATITGRWSRPDLTQNTQYLDSAGQAITLAPGATWVELVPTTVAVDVTP